jgi:hypothetical protein
MSIKASISILKWVIHSTQVPFQDSIEGFITKYLRTSYSREKFPLNDVREIAKSI